MNKIRNNNINPTLRCIRGLCVYNIITWDTSAECKLPTFIFSYFL